MATVERRSHPVEDVAEPAAAQARARLEHLYAKHGRRVHAICVSVLRDRHEAEDAAQQVFVSALRALLRGAQPRDPAAWLATIARNESRARARRQPTVPLEEELRDATRDDPPTLVVQRAELERLWRAIASLPASQRDALLLREVQGLGYDELVTDLRLSHPSVRSLLNRARRTLRERLETGAALLTGAPWPTVLGRVFGDAAGPALSSASRTAAAGLGALAITGGAVVAPTLTGHAARPQTAAHPAAHPAVHLSGNPGVAPTSPPPAVRQAGAAPPAPQRRVPRRLHEDRGGGSSDAPSSGGGGRGSDADGGAGATSGRGGPGSSAGDGSRGRDPSGTGGDASRPGDDGGRMPTVSDGSGDTSGGGDTGAATSGDTGSSGEPQPPSASSSGGSSDGSGGSGSDGSTGDASHTTSDGGGGAGGSSGSDGADGSGGS